MPGLVRRAYDASWGRLFAAGYDRMLAETEEAGMRDRRRELVARASGRVLELGAGTGLNLAHYGPAVSELVLCEPFEPMARRLQQRATQLDMSPRIVHAPAERLPLDDDGFDAVVSTLVLCTVDDPAAALAEVVRVLRPGGRLYFCEHVRSTDPGLARWQDRLEAPWRFVGHGCRCNRDTVATIAASGLVLEGVESGYLPKAAPIVRPLAVGEAVLEPRG